MKDVISCLACYLAHGVANFSDLEAATFLHRLLYVNVLVVVW